MREKGRRDGGDANGQIRVAIAVVVVIIIDVHAIASVLIVDHIILTINELKVVLRE